MGRIEACYIISKFVADTSVDQAPRPNAQEMRHPLYCVLSDVTCDNFSEFLAINYRENHEFIVMRM